MGKNGSKFAVRLRIEAVRMKPPALGPPNRHNCNSIILQQQKNYKKSKTPSCSFVYIYIMQKISQLQGTLNSRDPRFTGLGGALLAEATELILAGCPERNPIHIIISRPEHGRVLRYM